MFNQSLMGMYKKWWVINIIFTYYKYKKSINNKFYLNMMWIFPDSEIYLYIIDVIGAYYKSKQWIKYVYLYMHNKQQKGVI